MRSRRPQKTSFSLIELLVVVGIITILLSFLMPALKRAKESANAVQCTSNYRQIGTLNHTFADEYNGRHVGTGRRVTPTGAAQRITPLFNLGYIQPGYGRKLFVRKGTPKELNCPSVTWFQEHSNNAYLSWNWHLTGYDGKFNYSYDCVVENVRTEGDTKPPGIPSNYDYYLGTKISKVSNPADVIEMTDRTNSASNYSDDYDYIRGQSSNWGSLNLGWSEWDQAPTASRMMTFRHQGKATVLYLDGHVELEEPTNDLNLKERWRWR